MVLAWGNTNSLRDAGAVLRLFLIPIGGGIPGGVLLAQSREIGWPLTTVLYFVSDVILAFVFEPILFLFIVFSKRSAFLDRTREVMKTAMQKTTSLYGNALGPFALVLVAFGADPMTGRVVAVSAGHGIVTGWTFAILGDMLYFSVLMVSTLWLHDILGDGTLTTWVILALMIGVPAIIKRKTPLSD